MKKLVIVTHPDLRTSQINKAWLDALAQEPETFEVYALYDQYPALDYDVPSEQKRLLAHDEIIFQFPIHWYSTPFALKKYFDEVFTFGWAFGPGGDKLLGKRIGFAVSTGGDEQSYRQGLSVADLLNDVMLTFTYCGCEISHLHVFYGAMFDPSPEQIEENARDYVEAFQAINQLKKVANSAS
ncbi:MAG: NAD(P)H-dependent oxidoreductase [Bacteroidota bacterium]